MKGIRIFTQRHVEDLFLLDDASFVSEMRPICFPVTGSGIIEVAPGWLYCNGASLLRTDYKRLFDRIGTVYGSVDGTHFTLPDLCGRSPLPHADGQTGTTRVANAGALGNATAPGGVGGNDVVALPPAALPAHVHDKGTLSITAGGLGSHGNGSLVVYSANGTPAGSLGIRAATDATVTVNIPVTVGFSASTHAHPASDLSGNLEDGTVAGLGAGSPNHANAPLHLPATGMVIRV